MASEFIEKVLSGALEKQAGLSFAVDAPPPGSPITQRGNRAYSPPVEPPPGWWKTFGGGFSEHNEFLAFGRFLGRQFPSDFTVEERKSEKGVIKKTVGETLEELTKRSGLAEEEPR